MGKVYGRCELRRRGHCCRLADGWHKNSLPDEPVGQRPVGDRVYQRSLKGPPQVYERSIGFRAWCAWTGPASCERGGGAAGLQASGPVSLWQLVPAYRTPAGLSLSGPLREQALLYPFAGLAWPGLACQVRSSNAPSFKCADKGVPLAGVK
jgi:hypothetical protein